MTRYAVLFQHEKIFNFFLFFCNFFAIRLLVCMNRAKQAICRTVNLRKEVKKMKLRFKMLAAVMAALTMLLCMAVPIQAAVVKPDVETNWENTSSMMLTLAFPDDGYAEATITGKTGVTQINIDICVYRQSGSYWIRVGEAHTTIYGFSGGLSCQFNSIKRAYYRADYTFTVTKNGVDEVISKTKYATCS